MARKFDFQRTVTSSTIKVSAIHKDTLEIFETECTVTGKINDLDKALKIAQKKIETPEIAIIKVIDVVTEEALYGMTVTQFLENATKIIK